MINKYDMSIIKAILYTGAIVMFFGSLYLFLNDYAICDYNENTESFTSCQITNNPQPIIIKFLINIILIIDYIFVVWCFM